jgi:WD40 repeat protein
VIADGGTPKAWVTDDRLAAGNRSAAGIYDLTTKAWAVRVKGVAGAWAVSPDGSKLAATGAGLRLRLWDLTTGDQLHAENDRFPDAALLLPTPDGKSVFILADEMAYLWAIDKPTATPVGRVRLGKALAAAAGGGRLAVATAPGVLVYDDFDPTNPLPRKPNRVLTEHAANCRSVAVSPDGKRVAYSGDGVRVVITDAASGDLIRVMSVQTLGLALAFSPDNKTLAVVGRDGYVKLFAAEAPAAGPADANLWSVRVQRGQIGAVGFAPDGKTLAVSSSGVVKVLHAADGTEVFSAGGIYENGLVQHLTYTPDGRFVVAATEGSSGGVYVWDAGTGEPVRNYSTGFTVLRSAVFPDGTKAVSAGAEEAITVWDLTAEWESHRSLD